MHTILDVSLILSRVLIGGCPVSRWHIMLKNILRYLSFGEEYITLMISVLFFEAVAH
jgi:hypothetical protein